MMGKYLLLGGSSEISCSFIRTNQWHENDEIIAQYCNTKNDLELLAQNIPAKMTLIHSDFNDFNSTSEFINTLKDINFIPTHILHTPAIRAESQRLTDVDWSFVENHINVQCRSIYMVLHALLKPMSKVKNGRIVLVLSSYCLGVPPKFLSAYVMTKYALLGLGKSIAAEYATKNILVNMVSPSMMETKFVSNIHDSIITNSAITNPLKRNATPDDVANVICFLFSSNNTFITGTNIPVTGGEIF